MEIQLTELHPHLGLTRLKTPSGPVIRVTRTNVYSMKTFLKSLAFWPIALTDMYSRALSKVRPQWASELSDRAYAQKLAETTTISHQSKYSDHQVTLVLHTPNAACRWRAESFSTKEPETLEWIEQFGGHGAFYDIGANVGLYSLYYASLYPCQVYSFEPSVFNLGLLAKNIFVNSVSDRINIVPIPLSSKDQIAALHMGEPNEGGAMSTFGASFGQDGQSLDVKMTYRLPGLTLDTMIAGGMIPDSPSLIKLDVDGIEHLILSGAQSTLRSPTLRSVLVEVNDDFRELASEVAEHLRDAGFTLEAKSHGVMFEDGPYAASFNQIWVRI
jgi:FkbM family methyltransferase